MINEILVNGGIVLSFGWNSIGMGNKRGYELLEGLLVCHGPGHNDTICIAEKKLQSTLFDVETQNNALAGDAKGRRENWLLNFGGGSACLLRS